MSKAHYRKHNDGSLSSSTYHKKDGTNVRAILKKEKEKETQEHENESSAESDPEKLNKTGGFAPTD